MSKDIEFELRINLLKNNLSFLSKILMIATYCSGNCCCGHGFNNDSYSCQKAIDSIYKVMSYIEKNNDNYLLTKVKEIKIKYTDFLMRKYDKNICGVYLNKMAEICSNKDIFIYIINETNLLKEVMIKEVTKIHHSIECLEELVNLCENSEIFLHILIDLKNDDIILNKRLYREMLKKICSSSTNNNKLIFEKKIFNNILDLIFTTKTKYLTEIEGFFDVFFKSDSFSRLLYKKKLAIGEDFSNLITKLNFNGFTGYSMEVVIRIMLMFILMGEKYKLEEYPHENFYIEELKKAFKKLPKLNCEEYNEIKQYFEKEEI